MGDYYAATARILDMPVPYEAGIRVVDALVASGLLDPADHEPYDAVELDEHAGLIVQLVNPEASDGLDQLTRAGLADALVVANLPFTLFEDPGPEGYAGRCLDWRPGWSEPRRRDWDTAGPLLCADNWTRLRSQCDGDGTRLRRALDDYFSEVFDQPSLQQPAAERCDAHGVTAVVTRSAGSDGAPVVFVDTDAALEGPAGPLVRVHLNDAEIYVGVPYEDVDTPRAA